MESIIYNVIIGGVSVGLTFSKEKAHKWANSSNYRGKKEVRAVQYKEPHDLSGSVAYRN